MNERIEVFREIEIGEKVCLLIKQNYFPNESWINVYQRVSNKFTMLKAILRRFYGLEKKELTKDIWERINKYDEIDIEDTLSMENDFKPTEGTLETKVKKYTDNVLWVPVPISQSETLAKIKGLLSSRETIS